jgi:hypothetical protein
VPRVARHLRASPAIGQEEELADLDGPELAGGGENASNPLARGLNKNVALYVDVIFAIGGDKLIDWGAGVSEDQILRL